MADQRRLLRQQGPHPLVAVQERGGQLRPRGLLVGAGVAQHRRQRDREIAHSGGVVHVAEVDDAGDGAGFVAEHVGERQVGMLDAAGQRGGGGEGGRDAGPGLCQQHRNPVVRRRRPGGALPADVPVELTARVAVEVTLQTHAHLGADRADPMRQPRRHRPSLHVLARHHGECPEEVLSALGTGDGTDQLAGPGRYQARHRQVRRDGGQVPQCPVLHVQGVRTLGPVRDLQHHWGRRCRRQQEHLVALTGQRGRLGGPDAIQLLDAGEHRLDGESGHGRVQQIAGHVRTLEGQASTRSRVLPDRNKVASILWWRHRACGRLRRSAGVG